MTISRQRLKDIEAIRDEDIDYADIPETDAAFWADAALRMPQNKKGAYVRLDQDVLEWFKAQGPDYQTQINAILRAYMEAHQSRRDRHTPDAVQNIMPDPMHQP